MMTWLHSHCHTLLRIFVHGEDPLSPLLSVGWLVCGNLVGGVARAQALHTTARVTTFTSRVSTGPPFTRSTWCQARMRPAQPSWMRPATRASTKYEVRNLNRVASDAFSAGSGEGVRIST